MAEQKIDLTKGHQRSRIIRLTAGLGALALLATHLVDDHNKLGSFSLPDVFIWIIVLLAVVLLVWRERNQTLEHRRLSGEHARLIAAAEKFLDAFYILDAVRDESGEIVDFRCNYINSHGEQMFQMPREKLIDADLSSILPSSRSSGLFETYRRVVSTGEPIDEEFHFELRSGSEATGSRPAAAEPVTAQWRRHRVIRLGDGVAVTSSDASEHRDTRERYRSLSNFSNSVFENAPFSIIEAGRDGVICAMNSAAERLTGYSRNEVVGALPLTALHDPRELSRKVEDSPDDEPFHQQGFELLTAKASQGGVDEREWTYIRRDGSTLPVHLAVTAIRDGSGELSGFVAIASDISERKQMISYLNHMASHDQLTGLPGRTLLRERIAEAIEKAMLHGRKVAVFVIDFDHFKRMNDSLGHRTGDDLIVGMADRMRQSLRRSDTLGRLGGDEFVVVMPHIANIADVEKCARRLVDRVSSTATVGELEVSLTASVGVCVYPDFAGDVDSLLERADAAMYAAKEDGRNQYRLFSEEMLKASQERLSMDSALRHALAREEMFLHYQPIVSLTTGKVVGMEALLRWHHPKLGVVAPATFVPLAEETGLIVPIGEWAMKQSCRQAKILSDEVGIPLTISVNLSPRQFEQSNLLAVIEQSLAESGLPANQLQVELTENTLMINSVSNLEKLQHIRNLGARVAIDDFGTGFCSFSYLLQYPVDRLKIDQSFIARSSTEPNAATVVRTIVAMSHHLGIKVVAEGVESADHVKFLLKRHCDEVQGYYFSTPVAASSFADAVRTIDRAGQRDALRQEIADSSAGSISAGLLEDEESILQGPSFGRSPGKQIIM